MKANYAKCLELVLKHEGGYVNHPKDPGGATNFGVTQAVYDAYRPHAKQSVKFITGSEVAAIYRKQYWDKIKGDELPAGVDYAVFDFAVNSGVSRSAKYLQRLVGVGDDGQIGPATLSAVRAKNAATLATDLCHKRLLFLQGLKTFATFGKGWTRRVNEVRTIAQQMAGGK